MAGPVIDQHGAALVALGTLAALIERERTGRGQKVEVTMLRAALDLQQEAFAYHLNGFPVRRGPRHTADGFHSAPYGVYQTRDSYLILSMSPMAKLNAILQSDELKPYEDPALRFTVRREISRILAPILANRTTREWQELFCQHDIWCAPVHDFDQVLADPAVRHANPVIEFEHPRAGRVRLLGHPIRYGAGEPDIRGPPPAVGEHTEEILREFGHRDDEVAALRRAEVI